jgi:hypothetical protein
MTDRPPVPYEPGKTPPERRVSSTELEAVIRRATELEVAGGTEDSLPEEEVLRIGRELGLSPIHLRQALMEVRRKAPPAEPGIVARVMGPGYASAARVVQGNADAVRETIERYLLEMEHMVISRRHPDHTRYEAGRGIGTAVRRATTQLTVRSRFAETRFKELDVSVQPLEEGYALVTVGVDLTGARRGFFGGGLTLGTVMGMGLGTMVGIAVDPLAGIAMLPMIPAGPWAIRPIYASTFESTRQRLEAFLDRVQAGDLVVPGRPDWKKRLGLP